MAEKALVGIIMGSKSDLPVMGACTEQLEEFGVPFEMVIASAQDRKSTRLNSSHGS